MMKKKLIQMLVMVYMVLAPVSLFAGPPTININYNGGQESGACSGEITSIGGLFDRAVCILQQSVWPLLIALSVVVFIVGVIKYIAGADDESKRTEGRQFMIYGIIGLFVMVSVWGLVQIIQGTFGLENSTFIPQLDEN